MNHVCHCGSLKSVDRSTVLNKVVEINKFPKIFIITPRGFPNERPKFVSKGDCTVTSTF